MRIPTALLAPLEAATVCKEIQTYKMSTQTWFLRMWGWRGDSEIKNNTALART